jgi:hypothetical protein
VLRCLQLSSMSSVAAQDQQASATSLVAMFLVFNAAARCAPPCPVCMHSEAGLDYGGLMKEFLEEVNGGGRGRVWATPSWAGEQAGTACVSNPVVRLSCRLSQRTYQRS